MAEVERVSDDADQVLGPVVCHSLDSAGRTLCGASLTGLREPHPVGACANDGHENCVTCRSLWSVEGDDVRGDEMEAA